MNSKKIKLELSKDDNLTGYVYLPNHPSPDILIVGISKKQIHLHELIKNYKGADIIFDFDKNDVLIGIEILA